MVENPLKRLISDDTDENYPKKRKITEEKSRNNQTNGTKLIKLYCPVVSKITEIMAWEDQKLDLGTIASLFGIEPPTLRLNEHFISRGVDLIASSVTWNSLLSFFSYKGLSTGIGSSAAVVVDGKLSKSGSKRTREPAEADTGVDCMERSNEGVGVCTWSHHEESGSPNSKKLKNSDVRGRECQTARNPDTGLKRRHCVEDASALKKVRVSGSYVNENPQALERDCQRARHRDAGLKRRHWIDDTSPLKKIRVCGSYLNENPPGCEQKFIHQQITMWLPGH